MNTGDRVVQIPLEWPMRYGTVIESIDAAAHIAWDDGRREWIHEDDLESRGIWLVSPEAHAAH
jgi:hypothetical protein